MEKEGIGRPSTYASIISTIQNPHGYAEQRRIGGFYATEIGKTVTDSLLVQHFPKVMDVKFTSHLEEELDDIASGKMGHTVVLDEFWGPFSAALETARRGRKWSVLTRSRRPARSARSAASRSCSRFSRKNGTSFVECSGFRKEGPASTSSRVRASRNGRSRSRRSISARPAARRWFNVGAVAASSLAVPAIPTRKTTMNLTAEGKPVVTARTDGPASAEKCGSPMVIREGRRGPFLACTGYPKCKNAKDVDANGNPIRPVTTNIKCEKCGSAMMIVKKGQGPRGPFLACSGYPKCRSYKPLPAELEGDSRRSRRTIEGPGGEEAGRTGDRGDGNLSGMRRRR